MVYLVVDNPYLFKQLNFLPNKIYSYRIKRTIFIVYIQYTSLLNIVMGRFILHFAN